MKAYRTFVKDTLAERCRRKFLSLIDSQFHALCLNPGQNLIPLVKLNVPWNILVASRALCRLRLLVLRLSHKGGLADATPAAEAEEAVGVPWIFGELMRKATNN